MKRFYNNTLMSRVFKNTLRVVALLCVLLGFSSSAWGTTYYLWYNATSNQPNYKDGNFKMSSGATLTNNKCVWTISNLRKDNSYFYISTSSTYSESNLKSVNISTNNPNDAVVNSVGKQEYNGKVGFYVSCRAASSTVTITIDFSSNSQYVVSPTGGQVACTPSATIHSATYNGASISLSGSMTETCNINCYYGWQWNTDGTTWIYDNHIGGSTGTYNSTSPVSNYSNTWSGPSGGLVPGTTYYFRAYAYDNPTFHSDNKILSVKIPSSDGGGSDADCSNMVYLKPNANWNQNNAARFAAYFFNSTGNTWVDMKATTSGGVCEGLYYCEIPDGYPSVIFCRMNKNKTENSWTNDNGNGPFWNKTSDLVVPIGNNNLYTINDGAWSTDDKGSLIGSWSESPCTEGCSSAAVGTNVLLARRADVNKNTKTAKLFGYIKDTDCSKVTDYGFYYCTVVDGSAACTPNENSTKLQVDPSHELQRGEEFNATISDLVDGQTYYYRAYAVIAGKTQLSGEIRSFATDPCIPQYGGLSDKYNGNPIVYTINADPSFVANDCKLRFNSLQDAIDHLKATNTRDNEFKYVTKSGDSYNLNQPVIMKVHYFQSESDGELSDGYYFGTENVGNFAGSVKPDYSNLFEGINKTATDEKNTLTIKPGNKVAKPLIHHIVIRNSKNIVLDSLCIYSDPDGTLDNALEIDVNSTGWNNLTTGQFAGGNITIQNCLIHSSGFTGIHVSAYDGLTFKNNEFEALFKGSNDANTKNNMLNWGASVKFLACKNIKFIQNNFIGSHPTSLWLQECQNVLFMNNVFWNTNEFVPDKGSNKAVPSAVRLVSQYDNNIDNVGFYYNTFYFANNDVDASWAKYNFFNQCSVHRGGDVSKFGSDIYFKYNNCYSYDLDCPGKYDVTGRLEGNDVSAYYQTIDATSTSSNFCPNNFWSKYDEAQGSKTSAFAFGCSDNEFVNVSTQVCSTSAIKPSSLIVKGSLMNNGVDVNTVAPTIITSTNIALTEDEQYSDRYEMGVRPESGWTYGAYQSRAEVPTSVIYWIGNTSDWDDRNNWEYEKEEAGVLKRIPVSCVNSFSEDLKVVIEEVGTYQVADGRKWPQVPASFTENRTNSQFDEHVSAGLGTGKTPTKFASTIELEYGAGIKGVENLNDNGTLRYDKAIVHFDIEGRDREKWLLVGPVVRPFASGNDATNGTTRDVESGDYFKNYEPHIYMHEITNNNGEISWGRTFGDLNTPVYPNTVFAIQASKLYGPYFDNADDYLFYEGIKVNDADPVSYTFTGRFAVEEGEHNNNGNYVYTLNSGENLLNNVYPCNLSVQELEQLGTVNLYDYDLGSFVSSTGKNARVLATIRSQNGFVFTPNYSDLKLELSQGLLTEGSTRTRSGEIVMPSFSLNIDNANTTKPGASNIVISYDEFLGSDESLLNTPKVFTRNTDTPEAYIINKENKYTRLITGKENVSIPLGIRVLKSMNVTFEKVYNKDYEKVTLVDTKTRKEYNLLARSYTTDVLETGTTEGRFYLNLAYTAENVEDGDDNYEDVEDDDVSTEVEESEESIDINIYAVDGNSIHVITTGASLQTIYVSDMAGRTDSYKVEGNFAELRLPVAQGVYNVTVVTDKATKVGKVILK